MYPEAILYKQLHFKKILRAIARHKGRKAKGMEETRGKERTKGGEGQKGSGKRNRGKEEAKDGRERKEE